MARRTLLGLHDGSVRRAFKRFSELMRYETECADNLREMLERARSGEHVRYVMDANFGYEGSGNITPSSEVWEVVRDRVERGEAKFMAISGSEAVIEATRSLGIPAELKTDFTKIDKIFPFFD
jgi:hypothetical protein